MGRSKENWHKSTYARCVSNRYACKKERKNQRVRKAPPNFENLFLKKVDDSFSFCLQNNLSNDSFELRKKTQISKEIRHLDNSIDSNALSSSKSGNDTFDKLTKGISKMQLYTSLKQKKEKPSCKQEEHQFHKSKISDSSPSFRELSSSSLSNIQLFSSPKILPKMKPPVKPKKLKPKAKAVIKKAYKHSLNKEKNNKKDQLTIDHGKIAVPKVIENIQNLSDNPDTFESCAKNINDNKQVISYSSNHFIKDYDRLNIIDDKSSVLVTSTPTLRVSTSTRYSPLRGKDYNLNPNVKLNPDLSPVTCEESISRFDLSIESDSSTKLLSCNSDHVKLDSINIKLSKIVDNVSVDLFKDSFTPNNRPTKCFERKGPECYISLVRCDISEKYYSDPMRSELYNDKSYDSANASINLIRPKRRNVINNYNNSKRYKLQYKKKPSFLFTSFYSKTLMNSFISNKTASRLLKNSHFESSKEKHADSSIIELSSHLANTSLRIKCGKGWRRSIKESLKLNKQCLIDQSSLEDAGMQEFSIKPYLNKSSILQFEETEKSISVIPIQDFRSLILHLCNQSVEVPLNECFNKKMLSNCKKIGEGVYGEVFMTNYEETTLLHLRRVLKVMPIEGNFEVNGEPQKSFEEISSEVVVSMELSKLSDSSRENNCASYVFVHRSWCAYGSYTSKLLDLWDQYHEEKESENDRPDIFPDKQLYIVLEFNYGGQDLESFIFNNAQQAYGIFVQIALGLAVAEEELEFEHRDLHWGNVLIALYAKSTLDFKFKGQSLKIKSGGVKATIIDFTLSRMKYGKTIYFNDLSKDPSLFTAEGDYQFQVYRLMKDANKDNWNEFVPVTNIYWLHYVILKMINDCYYKNKSTKLHKIGLQKLKELEENILEYVSAAEFVSTLKELS